MAGVVGHHHERTFLGEIFRAGDFEIVYVIVGDWKNDALLADRLPRYAGPVAGESPAVLRVGGPLAIEDIPQSFQSAAL
jgi:hypothetical protein